MTMIGIRKKVSHIKHQTTLFLLTTFADLGTPCIKFLALPGFDLIEGIFVVAKRYNSSSATKHVSHGHGLVEVTFTLNRHDGNIICISGSDGGGEGRFSYVDMMYQTCRCEE
jgi:hypothetical protein